MRSRGLEERLGDLAWVLSLRRPLERAQALDVLRRIAERLELTLDRTRAEPGHASTRQIASPAWSAPEEIERDAPSDARTDVWAIGLIALRVLTGRSFWSSDESDYQALAVEVTTSRIPRASERLHELSREPAAAAVDAWFARCVERDPAARFASAADAVARLARALPIEAAAPRWIDRPHVERARPAPRSPGVLFAIGLLASVPLAVVVFIAGFGAGARVGGPPAPPAVAPRAEEPPRPPPLPAPLPPMTPLAPRAEPVVEETTEIAEPPQPAEAAPRPTDGVLDPWAPRRTIVREW